MKHISNEKVDKAITRCVLISIKPKWCEAISAGGKILEIRKNRPNCGTPFRCYIYETKGRTETTWIDEDGHMNFYGRGKVIGEFVCDSIQKYEAEFVEDDCLNRICEIYTDDDGDDCEIEETSNEYENPNECELCRKSCLTFEEIRGYIGCSEFGNFYGWCISELKIYDRPKELSEFNFPPEAYCEKGLCGNCPKYETPSYEYGDVMFDCEWKKPITKPPQSWCYVDKLEENNE